MGFWGDLVKVVRSSVFKNELKNGGFQVNSAEKLVNSRTIRTNLASTLTASFNGTANITPGVTGVLKIANGGTCATTAADARAQLGITLSNLGLKVKHLILDLRGGDLSHVLSLGESASWCMATISGITKYAVNGNYDWTDTTYITSEAYTAAPIDLAVIPYGSTHKIYLSSSKGHGVWVRVTVIYI